MNRPILLSLVAGVAFAVALPFAAAAQVNPFALQCPEYSPEMPVVFGGYPDIHDVAERLDHLRKFYTGKVLRFRLAGALTLQETAIGIRADQQAEWRAYTRAALALVPDAATVRALAGAPDEDPAGPEAFGRIESLADVLSAYGEKGEALKTAIENLRGKLTQEQLEAARFPRISLR
ncbi:hypothetical protein [Labrenzia sp. 011]|uniref:hypothetical protein n=1 Tax=Labrenzia sp. 011 TaxID=2171494 RepID=UPI000D51BA9E|nr:hypothetical protein [Labrenzia sp. 011]PVB59579.1 hypothetical protein DCO57_21520 [Labrenzia sp. 011]